MAHQKTVRHFHEPGHLHELTFSCYQRLPLLINDTWLEKLARCIDAAGKETATDLVGFVFMPEHVHLLVYPKGANPSISLYLARVKQPFSKQIKELLMRNDAPLLARLTVLERPGKSCFRFWQEGPGFYRNLFSPKAIALSLAYFHSNPVTRGLCQRAADWKWSSARYYLDLPGGDDPQLPSLKGLSDGTLS